jgi:hypothetical protein
MNFSTTRSLRSLESTEDTEEESVQFTNIGNSLYEPSSLRMGEILDFFFSASSVLSSERSERVVKIFSQWILSQKRHQRKDAKKIKNIIKIFALK